MERQSTDSKPADKTDDATEPSSTEPEKEAAAEPEETETAAEATEPVAETTPDVETSKDTPDVEVKDTEPAKEESEQEKEAAPTNDAPKEEEVKVSSDELQQLKTTHQEEVQEYVERIDSLESKLQYLSRTAADSSRQAANQSTPGSTERKLAEKDEKIALLMEEGQKLASGEQKYRTIIKKLRQQFADSEKQNTELKKSRDKAAADAESLRTRLNSSEEKEKRQEETRKATAVLQKEIDALKKEKSTRDEAVRKLERDLRTKTEEASRVPTLSKNLASEREKLKKEEEGHAAVKAERDSLAEKSKQESVEWSEKLDRAVERGRTAEEELRVEMKAMETKLEVMRTQAEEATSGSGGEAQVKLLRQIETLQSQYASASSNWQSMEASLLAKLSNLEKERDEAQKRESEMRKKARDSVCFNHMVVKDTHANLYRLRGREPSTKSCRMFSRLSTRLGSNWTRFATS